MQTRLVETRLWLLRHPEPDRSVAGRCYGSLDVLLSETGIRQAHTLAQMFAKEPFADIYTSPLKRCVHAASILASGRPCSPAILDALRELNFGDLEGRSYAEIESEHPELYREWMEHPTQVTFPGGENFGAMQARVLSAVTALRARHCAESLALVTHAGVIRTLLADALGLPPDRMFRIGQRYAAVNLIRYLEDSAVVELVNAPAPGGHFVDA